MLKTYINLSTNTRVSLIISSPLARGTMSSSQFGGIIFRQYNIPTAEKWNKIINLLEDKEPDYEYKWENIFESWDDIREKLSNKSGIYMIACRKTGKYYVGSSR